MQKNSLSLCMIVKDAEETIGRAIKSALAVVDEVVVVDTGSSDNTRLIVEGYGARVVDFPWRDDFAAARNAGLEAAFGDWILVMDADEVLEGIRPVEVNRLLSNEDALAFWVRVRNEVHGRGTTEYDRIRLFRNHPDIRYVYPVHEQITPGIARTARRVGGGMLPSTLRITHYGSAEREEQGKKARNQRLLRKAIAEFPGEPYFHYQLACEMAVHLDDRVLPVKGFARMLEHLQAAVEGVEVLGDEAAKQLGYGPDLRARHANALLAAGRPREALASVEEGLELHGDAALLVHVHGCALLALAAEADTGRAPRLLERARRAFESNIGRRRRHEPAPISAAYADIYPLRYLGLVALAAGDRAGARSSFEKALRLDPGFSGALCGLARVAEREGRPKEALQLYLKALSLSEAEVDAWVQGAELLTQLGFRDNAASWLHKLSGFLPEHPRLARRAEELRGLATVGG